MAPATVDETKYQSRSRPHRCQWHVRPSAGRQSDYNDRPPGTHKLREARERLSSIHVVKRRDGHDGVEGLRLQHNIEHVTSYPLDVPAIVARTRSVENGLIYVETDHLAHTCINEFRSQKSITASNVEHTRSVGRE